MHVGSAYACTNNEDGQAGVAGEIEYFSAEGELKYCDGNNWRSVKGDYALSNTNTIYTQDFESGLTANEWGPDITANYSQFLGRFPGLNGAQGPNRTFTLSGTQDSTTLTFKFNRFDNFGTRFRLFLDDTQIINEDYAVTAYNVPSGGTNGNVTWTVSSDVPISADFAYGTYSEQIYTYNVTITNPGVTTLKVGFGVTGVFGIGTAAWGIDDVQIDEVVSGTPTTIYSENFESGLTPGDWGLGETISYSTFLGKFASTGTGQGPFKIIPLSGSQDTTTITFDFYEIDSWDTEYFSAYVDDLEIFEQQFNINVFETGTSGTTGSVTWVRSNLSQFLTNSCCDSRYPDQTHRYALTITNPGATSVKLGFGNSLDEGESNEAVGIDNISVVETVGGTPSTVFTENFESPLPADDWGADISVTLDGMFGRFANTGGVQGPNRTFSLPGTQDTTTISFEFYEIGGWENEPFTIYIDDTAIVTENYNGNYFDSPSNGTNGSVSWTVTPLIPISFDIGFEPAGGFNNAGRDQIFQYTFTITNPGATSVKLGFGASLNSSFENESWAIDDLDILYTQGGTPTQVFNDDFNTGFWAHEWDNTSSASTTLSTFLGRHPGTGGAQTLNRTFTLSGAQDTTTIEFDFYEIDSWDNEDFRTFIDDTQIFSHTYRYSQTNYPPSGSTGNVSYSGTAISGGTYHTDFSSLNSGFTEQMTRYTLVLTNPSDTTVKLGFGATINESLSNESWGIDNVRIYETASGVDTLVYQDDFEGAVTGWSDNSTESGGTQSESYVLTKTTTEGDYDLDFSATETLAPSTIQLTSTESSTSLTSFLGRFSNTGGVQGPNKTFTLPGTQEITTVTFDFYEIDTWDSYDPDSFYVFIDDVQVFSFGPLSVSSFNRPLGDTELNYLGFNLSSSLANLGFGSWNDQIYQFVFRVENPGATSIKVGFAGLINETVTNEAWGIDNFSVTTNDLTAASALTTCSVAGDIFYDSTNQVYAFCDGTDLWSITDITGSTGAVCSLAGELEFNAVTNKYSYCDGSNYVEIGNF